MLYLVAGFVGSRRRDAATSRPANGQRPAPLAGWPWALILLVVVAVLITLRWADLPARVDVVTARAGLQASTLLRDGANWFVPDLLPIPALASAVAAVGQSLTGDALLGVRLAGLVAGLLLIAARVAAWLRAIPATAFGRRIRRGDRRRRRLPGAPGRGYRSRRYHLPLLRSGSDLHRGRGLGDARRVGAAIRFAAGIDGAAGRKRALIWARNRLRAERLEPDRGGDSDLGGRTGFMARLDALDPMGKQPATGGWRRPIGRAVYS